MARQTPPEARPRRPHHGAIAQALEGCSPEPAGRPLEAPGDGVSRWMVAAALPGNAEQNPAYRPTRPPCPSSPCVVAVRRTWKCSTGLLQFLAAVTKKIRTGAERQEGPCCVLVV